MSRNSPQNELNAKINSIYLEKIVTTMGYDNFSYIYAPDIANRTFICWINCTSVGWVGSFYFYDPSVKNTTVWSTVNGKGGQIECYALYRNN